MTPDEAPQLAVRENASVSHEYDLEKVGESATKGIDDAQIAELTEAVFEDPNLEEHAVAFDDESPYPEVRCAVPNTDDPSMPVTTVRTWAIGLAWAILIPGLNQFFFFRFPSVTITGIVAQLLSFPIGRAAAAWIPNIRIFGLCLNPGPFTVKEHVL